MIRIPTVQLLSSLRKRTERIEPRLIALIGIRRRDLEDFVDFSGQWEWEAVENTSDIPNPAADSADCRRRRSESVPAGDSQVPVHGATEEGEKRGSQMMSRSKREPRPEEDGDWINRSSLGHPRSGKRIDHSAEGVFRVRRRPDGSWAP